MARYAIGDLQGCHAEFVALLDKLSFDPGRDCLWLVGDLVNRGPGSLECLRETWALGDAARVVLGNHDLHLLAVARGGARLKRNDTLQSILDAPDREPLLDWLQSQPLMVTQDEWVMTHAGLLPQWTVPQATLLAREIEQHLTGEQGGDFLERMYGNDPDLWRDDLAGVGRLRFIVNAFTRMRFIDAQGRLEFSAKESLDSSPSGFAPWFTFERVDDPHILFGHWAALEGHTPGSRVRVEALDTGCVWGNTLTALNLETGERIHEPRHATQA
ncbi:symmetrical bis(5'-nucleosyl)-tetraphosphatase [Litchfieldella xinjiangensis]|uniref:symmetrical bis(5'-nucleosyl)-tetraphosphatase n=1 Tax=Litchfieldella xinjiangensis TaxID=1166948 RepID=UPI0005BAED11|nr:symmetrical bis(5'-nucleosyl)-tetraphosphatase [Halomonas xinjiangensis]